MAQGDDVVPIPGCSRRQTLADTLDALKVDFSTEELERIEAATRATQIIGTRYPKKQMTRLGL